MRNTLRLFLLALLVGVSGGFAQAQSTDLAATKSFTLQPGGKATISFEAFCINFGLKFPDQKINPPTGVVDSATQNAMYYALTKGYQQSQPLEMQYAIWQTLKAANLPASGATASEIVAATTTAPAPTGTSVLDAVKDGKLKFSFDSWAPVGNKVAIGAAQDYFYGSGKVMVENTSKEALTLYMPIGTIFGAPDASSQNVAGYATDVQVNNPSMPSTGIADNVPLLLLSFVGIGLLVAAFGLKRAARPTMS